MYYTIYKTTCLINGKFYIGKHQTKNLDDGYFGSGKVLLWAIKKYGMINFTTEIIAVYDTEQQMNLAEQILVVLDSEISYNLCKGGQGGFGYINNHGKKSEWSKSGIRALRSQGKVGKTNKRWVDSMREVAKNTHTSGKLEHTLWKTGSKKLVKAITNAQLPEVKIRRKETQIARNFQQGKNNSQYGKPRSAEVKKKISETLKKKYTVPGSDG
jgi:hypothetical protein